jgi:hypothetical protein
VGLTVVQFDQAHEEVSGRPREDSDAADWNLG